MLYEDISLNCYLKYNLVHIKCNQWDDLQFVFPPLSAKYLCLSFIGREILRLLDTNTCASFFIEGLGALWLFSLISIQILLPIFSPPHPFLVSVPCPLLLVFQATFL